MRNKWIKIENEMVDGKDVLKISTSEVLSWIEVFGLLDLAILNKKDEYLTGTIAIGEEHDNTSTSTETDRYAERDTETSFS